MLFIVLLGFVLQFQWMNHMKETGDTDVVTPAFAEKIKQVMLRKKGLPPDALSTGAKPAEQVPCEHCMEGGTIITPEGERAICPICFGVGYHMVRRFDPAEKYCPACGGMGRVKSPDTGLVETCVRCNGRGLVLTQTTADPAPDAE